MRAAGDMAPSAMAAAGVSLDELSASRGNNARAPRPAIAPRVSAPSRSGGNIEVIRGGRIETVAN